MRRRPRNDFDALPLPVWGEGWGEGDTELSRDLNPSPHPSPYGRGSRPSALLALDPAWPKSAVIAPSPRRNVHFPALSNPEKRTATAPIGSIANAIASSPGS